MISDEIMNPTILTAIGSVIQGYSFKATIKLKFCIQINIANTWTDYLVNQPTFLAIFKMAPVQFIMVYII